MEYEVKDLKTGNDFLMTADGSCREGDLLQIGMEKRSFIEYLRALFVWPFIRKDLKIQGMSFDEWVFWKPKFVKVIKVVEGCTISIDQ